MKKTRKQVLIERHEQLLLLNKQLTRHEKTEHFDMSVIAQKTPCGTSCCLAGHAGMQTWFRKRGFKTLPFLKDADEGDQAYLGDPPESMPDDQDIFSWFFGENAYDDMFHHSYNNHFPSAMKRVRERLKRIKAMTDEEAAQL